MIFKFVFIKNIKTCCQHKCDQERPSLLLIYLVEVMEVVAATEVEVRTPFVVSVAVVALAVEDAGPDRKQSICRLFCFPD